MTTNEEEADADASITAPTGTGTGTGRYTFSPALHWNPQVQAYFSAAYGALHFARISKALARPSSYSCIRVNTLCTSPQALHHKLLSHLRRTSFANDASCISHIPALPHVLCVRGTGPHHPHPHPQPPLKEVVVSRKCAEAVLRGAQIYVPGVMACSAHLEEGDKVAVSVAVEKLTHTGAWSLAITRGTVLHGDPSGNHSLSLPLLLSLQSFFPLS